MAVVPKGDCDHWAVVWRIPLLTRLEEPKMRRVVVTGLGMLTPLACGVEPTWRRLLDGKSGAKHIEHFDVSDLPVKSACQVPRGDGSEGTYNPDQWMEPKDQSQVD